VLGSLIGILNKRSDVVVAVLEVTLEDFHDWVTISKKELYANFPAVLKYHLFESEDIEDVSMHVGDGQIKEWANIKFPRTEEDQLCTERL
jgi:hypothetical protein